jgi:uncharacterized FlgJ-related protein
MIVILGSLVILQLLLAGVFGLKPSFKAGYYIPSARDLASKSPGLSEERLRELESILAPPPELAWIEENRSRILGDSASTDTSRPSDDQQDSGLPKVKPVPIPEIADEGIIFGEGDTVKIAPKYIERFPDLEIYSSDDRKKYFVAIMLPLILRANVELAERRQLIVDAVERGDVKVLRQWAELYRLETDSTDVKKLRQELLLRVDQVPVSIALAQSAIETGWGTSRFAIEGNAGFGQWAWSNDSGIKPSDARYENVVVRSFANIFDSVRAYMHNLNTYGPYETFRRVRQKKKVDIHTLASTLRSYSEEGEDYVEKVGEVIKANNFTLFDNAVLLPE